MSLLVAVKRSWHYFIPESLLDLRRLVRQLYIPAYFFVMGWAFGIDSHGGPGRYSQLGTAVVVLILLKSWAGKYEPGDFQYQAEDGTWRRCAG